jgi:hypothetical protein
VNRIVLDNVVVLRLIRIIFSPRIFLSFSFVRAGEGKKMESRVPLKSPEISPFGEARDRRREGEVAKRCQRAGLGLHHR